MAEISPFSVEAARQNCNIDWRAHKSCFNEQMAHFCMSDSEEMADVEFVLNRGFQRIPVHSFVLTVVFQKELTLAQLQSAIRIDDFHSFVNLKAKYEAKAGTVNCIEWFIGIDLRNCIEQILS